MAEPDLPPPPAPAPEPERDEVPVPAVPPDMDEGTPLHGSLSLGEASNQSLEL